VPTPTLGSARPEPCLGLLGPRGKSIRPQGPPQLAA
jgi:hypothetical protein